MEVIEVYNKAYCRCAYKTCKFTVYINYAVHSSKGEVLKIVLHSEDDALICSSIGIGGGSGEMLSSNNAKQV